MNKSLFLILLSLSVLPNGIAQACDLTPINDDNALVGDRMYSISDNSYLEAANYIGHSLAVLDKEGTETHRLSPMLLTTQRGKVIAQYKVEDLTLKSSNQVTVSKKGGTTCGWKDGKPTVETKIPKELWNGDVEVLSLSFEKDTKRIILEVKETCDRGDYTLDFLDSTKEKSKDQLYFKVSRTPIAPGICKPEFSETVRIVAGLPPEVLKPKTTMVVIGSSSTSGSTVID
jgi:hypothetical protein